MELEQKLAILSEAARYDASCASSGSDRQAPKSGGLGGTCKAGIVIRGATTAAAFRCSKC